MGAGKKLNIAMVCDPVGDFKAGVVVSMERFGSLLAKRGHKIIYIGAKDKSNKTNGHFTGGRVYRFRSIPVPKSGGWHLAFPTVGEIKKILLNEEIDIVHLWLPMSGAVIAQRAARALRLKVIAHSHSQPENLFMDMPKFIQPFLSRTWNRFLAWLYSKAEIIIYPSEMAQEILHHLCEKDKPSVVISNGVDIEKFKPRDTGNFHERQKLERGKLNLVYIGRLHPEKSVDTFVKAMPIVIKSHPNARAVIVGGGHLRLKLEKLAENLGVKNHIKFLGVVNNEDLIHAFNVADIFVSPSLAELEGMTVLEAMACGKPVIIANGAANAARFFVKNNGLLFEQKNHKDLAEKISVLLKDENLRKKMASASLALSRRYDINLSLEKLESVFYSLAGNRQPFAAKKSAPVEKLKPAAIFLNERTDY